MLVLLIGDLHVPARAPEIPPKFKRLLVPGKISQILCTGNLTDRATHDFLRQVAPDCHFVKGDYDETPNLPLSRVVRHGSLRIGVTNGHTIVPASDADALLIAARQMDVDVFIWGSSHRFEAYELEGKFFINPGSATGAISSGWWADDEEPVPSFVLMDVQGNLLVLYVYHLINDEVKVEKFKFEKGAEGGTSTEEKA
ncbi:putative Vacuolar protein sorting 29 [Taphrina deformans PYCC 5710]|uniref:Vacuolar protein sorting-associated protein 29 n=1 Tax=Taphrina deformans (strain PYCC 5710 / ATCC 11124 / CBS 356.35 / IMI 108563 / JCM 9778 / NBRC 8474) TaxID=1097556 RepID=R4X8I3_TAPDE|nr:putative Vacuolar protein sorting 29 [Taphrina deformans PYCC 5710]|eukprot:CCG81913.1 putative Vacuolar protein sorting 29 [Taphrina deformans PYCC 5710]